MRLASEAFYPSRVSPNAPRRTGMTRGNRRLTLGSFAGHGGRAVLTSTRPRRRLTRARGWVDGHEQRRHAHTRRRVAFITSPWVSIRKVIGLARNTDFKDRHSMATSAPLDNPRRTAGPS